MTNTLKILRILSHNNTASLHLSNFYENRVIELHKLAADVDDWHCNCISHVSIPSIWHSQCLRFQFVASGTIANFVISNLLIWH